MSTVQSPSKVIDLGDVTLIEIPYKIGGNEFTLKEASGDAACIYRNALFKETELGSDGKPSKIGKMADVEPLLVSLCLFNSGGHRIAVSKIREWPNRVIKALYDKVKEISDLGEESEDKTQLENALSMPGSPCEFSALQNFIETLPEEGFGAIKTWIGKSSEDKAKNVSTDTGDGLD